MAVPASAVGLARPSRSAVRVPSEHDGLQPVVRTNLDNLVLLCYRHHWMIHEGGWQLAREEAGPMLAILPSRTHRSWIRPPVGDG